GGSNSLPSCSVDSTVACINDGRSCGEHSDATTWFEDGDELLSHERTCQYGDKVNDEYVQQVEFVCKDGVTTETGVTRQGGIKNAGQCSSVPFNCGTHLDSTAWWEAENDLSKVSRQCEDMSFQAFNYYNSEKEMRCDNGKVTGTGKSRLVGLEKIDNCPGENNCGSHTEGSTWFIGSGTIQSPRTCSDSAATPVVDTFIRMKELKCINGSVVDQAVTLVGDSISFAECPGTQNCGDRHDGETWKEVLNEEITEKFICSDRLTQTESRFKKVQVKQCTNGVITVKETIKGNMLSIGTCPRKGCSPFLDGEKWLADLGLETVSPKECPYGPTEPAPVFTFVNLQEAKCENGETKPTGYLQRGDKKSESKCYTCAPNTKQACAIPNGNGYQICKADGSGYNSCLLESCKAGYFNQNGTCVPQVCTPKSKATCEPNSSSLGFKTCNDLGSAYGTCTFDSCKEGYVKVSEKSDVCAPVICPANSFDRTGCTGVMPGGYYERQCNSIGTEYMSCGLKCTDGSNPRDGKCTTYTWTPTNNWSQCNLDCGGSQTQEYVCKNNFGETVSDSLCTSKVKPMIARLCNSKTSPWTEGFEVVSPSTREVCPGLYLGYIEKVFQRPVTYSCVDFQKVKTLGNQVLLSTNNYCSAIQPARCSHDSLSITESLGRLDWMKACQKQVPVIGKFFEIIGGADQLSTYLNDTSSSLYGKPRPRPLYVTFSDEANKPWIAPKKLVTKVLTSSNSAKEPDCTTPPNVKVFGICTSSCYTPDQKLLFKVGDKQQYIPIIDAINQKQDSIMTLAPDSMVESLKFTSAPIAHFISELVETNHKVLIFTTGFGGRLSVTFNHPLVGSDGVIREASEFKVGDQLIRADGSFDDIKHIEEIVYPGKVHNVLPYGDSTLGNIVVSEGFLSGSAYYQNDGVNYMNQKILRSNLLNGVDLNKK
ncbi:MAG: hypothetical protein K2Q18_18950, partial [Bdellovibrionales bacterium]|nr:hypothetical protein [Bdellovibrionales bacterium]